MEDDKKIFDEIQDFMNLAVPISPLPEEVDVTTELIPMEEAPDINDAPTMLNPKHSFGEGERNQVSPKAEKRNIRPIEKKIERKKQRKNKRKK